MLSQYYHLKIYVIKKQSKIMYISLTDFTFSNGNSGNLIINNGASNIAITNCETILITLIFGILTSKYYSLIWVQ